MRRNRILGLSLAICMILNVFTGVSAYAAVENIEITQTAATATSVSFTWKTDDPVDIYVDSKLVCKGATEKKYTLSQSGMSAGTRYSVVLVKAGEPMANGTAYTVCTKPNKTEIIEATYAEKTGVISINWTPDAACSGYQIMVDAVNGSEGGTGYIQSGDANSFDVKMDKNMFYKLKARGYVQLLGKHAFGSWSDYRYAAVMSDVNCEKGKSLSIDVSWKKVTGASKYVISVGRLADGSDAVKTTTVSKKKSSVTITSMGGKPFATDYRAYYTFVTPVVTVSKKDKLSDLSFAGDPISFSYNDK